MKKTALFTFAVAVMALPALAGGVNSGLNIGESLSAFEPTHVSGPDKGTDTCPVCKYGALPAVQVWVNQDDAKNVDAIASTLNASVKSSKHNLKGFVVMLTMCDQCVAMANDMGAKTKNTAIGITRLPVTSDSVKDYKINTDKQVKNTIFVYKDRKVVAKFVNLKGDKAGLAELQAAIAKVDR